MWSFVERRCPCGEEPIDGSRGGGVLGASCIRVVTGCIWSFFGRRGPEKIADLVQECFEKLLAPKGLDCFELPPGVNAADAFRAWLRGVTRNHCLRRLTYDGVRELIEPEPPHGLPEPSDSEAGFAIDWLRQLAHSAMLEVEPRWRARGQDSSERFDVFWQLISQDSTDYAYACEKFSITEENARVIKARLKDEINQEVRKQVLDTLLLEPGLDEKAIDRKIDEEIEALFLAAFPSGCVWDQLGRPRPDGEGSEDERESEP
jgi:DNA-directed RNA polymerase specialized sigma24 family protein